MLSLKEDTVLDPFLGTGTTTMAAMATGRNSIGFEIDPNFTEHLSSRFKGIVDFANQLIESRINAHLEFTRQRIKTKGALGYTSKVYGFPVMTNQETEIEFAELKKVVKKDNTFEVEYREKPTFKILDDVLLQKGKSLKNWIEDS